MTGVARVGFGPPPCGALSQKRLVARTATTLREPRRDIVGEMARVLAVIERELFERAVAGVELVEFVVEVPLAVTPAARDRGRVVDLRIGVVGIASIGHGSLYWRDGLRPSGRSASVPPARN